MARYIWKYFLYPGVNSITMPAGAKMLVAREQGEQVFALWAEINPDLAIIRDETRYFVVYATGEEMPDNPGTYLGTAILHGGRLVYHAYELAKEG